MTALPESLRSRAEGLLGAPIVGTEGVQGGFSQAIRLRLRLRGGGRAFLKAGVTPATAGFLRDEARIYTGLRAPFLPELLAWEDGEVPVLLLEDLGDCERAPPWTPEAVGAVLRSFEELAQVEAPPGLPPIEALGSFDGWSRIAEDPAPFLRLTICTERWLEGALPALVEAEAEARLGGDRLLHLDVRGDNLALRGGRAVLFDWNWAHRGNPALDRGFWAPSLRMQGGPEPEAVVGHEPGVAAAVSGFFASQAGLPPPPDVVGDVRAFQLEQLRVALPWACRALGLPAPPARDGRFGGSGRG